MTDLRESTVFNDDSNSLRIHVHNLKSISGDDLNLSASDNKNDSSLLPDDLENHLP